MPSARDQYIAITKSPEFVAWKVRAARTLAGEEAILRLWDRDYASVAIEPAAGIRYPFLAVGSYDGKPIRPFVVNQPDQQEYAQVVKPVIRYPDQVGFMLTKMYLNESGQFERFESSLCTYWQTVMTSHVLEAELVRAYTRCHGRDLSRDDLYALLPRRSILCAGRTLRELIAEPFGYAPLLSVQALVQFKDYTDGGKWKLVILKRSDNVSALPGAYQFPPAGGFEASGETPDTPIERVREHFNIEMMVLREFVEEFYNYVDAPGAGPLDCLQHHGAISVKAAMQTGKGAINFIGMTFCPLTLRSCLSFILTLDSPDVAHRVRVGSEESLALLAVTPAEVQALVRQSELVPDSASLYRLAEKSGFLADPEAAIRAFDRRRFRGESYYDTAERAHMRYVPAHYVRCCTQGAPCGEHAEAYTKEESSASDAA